MAGRTAWTCRLAAQPLNWRSLASRQPDGLNPPLPDEVAGEIGKQLQLTLVELIALSLAGKQLQWTSYGREFVSVHRHLGQVVPTVRGRDAELAELGKHLERVGSGVGSRLKIYPDAAHGFLFQHHAEFAADIDAFLAGA